MKRRKESNIHNTQIVNIFYLFILYIHIDLYILFHNFVHIIYFTFFDQYQYFISISHIYIYICIIYICNNITIKLYKSFYIKYFYKHIFI